jgi:hypothetical protein
MLPAGLSVLKLNAMSNRTTKKIITFTLDADMPVSADEQVMLARLAAMPDSDIDCSDIPPSSTEPKDAAKRPL